MVPAVCVTNDVGVADDRVVPAARRVWFESGWQDTPVYRRDLLPADARIEGPALVEQMDSTVLIEPGCSATGDADGNLVIAVGGRV